MNPTVQKTAELIFCIVGGIVGANVAYVLLGPLPKDTFTGVVYGVLFCIVTWTVMELVANPITALHDEWWEKRNIR